MEVNSLMRIVTGRHPLRQTTGVTPPGPQSRPGPRPNPAPHCPVSPSYYWTVTALNFSCSALAPVEGVGAGKARGSAFPYLTRHPCRSPVPGPSETKRGGWAEGTGGGCGAQSDSEGRWLRGATESRTQTLTQTLPQPLPFMAALGIQPDPHHGGRGGRGTEIQICLSACQGQVLLSGPANSVAGTL